MIPSVVTQNCGIVGVPALAGIGRRPSLRNGARAGLQRKAQIPICLSHYTSNNMLSRSLEVLTTRTVFVLAFLCLPAVAAHAEESSPPSKRSLDQVLLVCNSDSPASRAIADDYAKKRHIKNLLLIHCQDSALRTKNETMTLAAYKEKIERPVREYLAKHPEIDFIVLTKGIPITIVGAALGSNDEKTKEPAATRGRPSVDSYLAALDYSALPGTRKIELVGSGAIGVAYSNRYWNAARPFSHARFGGYLVTRLDGYTESDAMALVSRALAAEEKFSELLAQGKVLLDVQPKFGLGDKATQPGPIAGDVIKSESPWSEFNADMRHASDVLTERGIPVELDLRTWSSATRSVARIWGNTTCEAAQTPLPAQNLPLVYKTNREAAASLVGIPAVWRNEVTTPPSRAPEGSRLMNEASGLSSMSLLVRQSSDCCKESLLTRILRLANSNWTGH